MGRSVRVTRPKAEKLGLWGEPAECQAALTPSQAPRGQGVLPGGDLQMETVPIASLEENATRIWGFLGTLSRCRCGGMSSNVRGGGQPMPQQESFGERPKQHWDARTWLEVSGAARPGWCASLPLCIAWFALTLPWSQTHVCPCAEDTSEAGGGQGDTLHSIPQPQWCREFLGRALHWRWDPGVGSRGRGGRLRRDCLGGGGIKTVCITLCGLSGKAD